MLFTVTYREKDGAQAEIEIEAANRAACMAACKARGIAPVGVREGRSRTGHAKAGHRLAGKVVFLAIGVLCALVLGGAWWFLGRSGDVDQAAEAPKRTPKTIAPPVATSPKPIKPREAKPQAVKAKPPEPSPIEKYISDHRFKGDRSKLSKEGLEGVERREKFLDQLAKDPKLQFQMTNIPQQAEATFKNPTEQVMDWVFNATVGPDSPPPLPMISGYELEDLPKVLEQMSEIKEGDDETVIARKKMVDAAKAELKDYMARGGNARDFLQFYHQQLEHYHDLWIDATSKAEEVCRTEDPETARKFLERTNQELAKKGIAPIQVRKGLRKRIGLPVEEDK